MGTTMSEYGLSVDGRHNLYRSWKQFTYIVLAVPVYTVHIRNEPKIGGH